MLQVRLQELVAQSVALDRELHRALKSYPEPLEQRSRLGVALARVSLQHSRSIISLLHDGLDHGALALLRPQSEAIARSYWVRLAASEQWIEAAFQSPNPEPKIEPAKFPRFAEIPNLLRSAGQHEIANTLERDYSITKDQMNSYTHGGLRAVWLTLGGLEVEAREFTLRLATSKMVLAWSLIAIQVLRGNNVPRMARAIDRYRDCQLWVPKAEELTGLRQLATASAWASWAAP